MISIHHFRHIETGKLYFEGECLSTDTKDVKDYYQNGSKLLEMDTGKIYMFDEENQRWREWA